MKIPVILLNYNSTADCHKCISFLLQQEGIELEIIVVDNCSSANNRIAIEDLCKQMHCTFIANDKNLGYNAGNNMGLRYASSKGYEYALIANPDMEFPQKDTLHKMADAIQQDDAIVALGTDVVTKEGIHQNPRLYKQQKWQDSFNWVKEIFHKSNNAVPDWVDNPTESHYCTGLNGCYLLLRMSFMQQIGYFDDRIFLYGEEPIFASQVKQSGKKMFYAADIKVIHDHKKSMEGNPLILQKYWQQSRLHHIKYYSNYPWYGKLYAITSIKLYFILLKLKAIIKK